jgi:hypothetical protein
MTLALLFILSDIQIVNAFLLRFFTDDTFRILIPHQIIGGTGF